MSDRLEGTNKSPDGGSHPLSPRPVFAAGDAVPGLSSWVLERKLGGGGFGEVWLARHVWDRDQKPRAVKFCTDPAAKHRLVTHERNVVVRVMKYAGKHPNIVPLLDCNLDGDIPWLMYEFVEGGTLATLIAQWRPFPLAGRLENVLRTLHAISAGLAACHRLDPPLVHRDMKPQNVLMAGPVPRITDFGIGGVVMEPKDGGTTGALTAYAARLPSVLHSAGTRLYAPPEQMLGSPPDPRDDVYALGVIAYQMVTGDAATGPGTDANLELCVLKLPGELTSLIVRSVGMRPERRPKDAAEWEAALAALLAKSQKRPDATTGGSLGSRPVLLPEPKAAPVRASAPKPPPLPPQPRPAPAPAPPPRAPAPPAKDHRKRVLAAAGGSVILCGFAAALVLSLLPSRKPSDQRDPGAARVELPHAVPVGAAAAVPTAPKADAPKASVPEPKRKEPEPKADALIPKAGEEREIEIAAGVKMKFCWIPPGTAMLGSPEGEAERSTDEKEYEYRSRGFWMGKYEVTQAEWKAVMGDNPSYFDGKKDNKAKGLDTLGFPVESVSWDRICGKGEHVGGGFLDKIDHGGIQRTLGKSGRFRLPTDSQWEYACRGGRRNVRPFFWGYKLNGTEANCDGRYPYGLTMEGQYLDRTCAVNFTNDGQYEVHPWGLMHTHGNVLEWCEDIYDETRLSRVLRGGSWCSSARLCRVAMRIGFTPDFDSKIIGLRLVVHALP